MYSRDFGGIKSEGQLYNMEREYNENRENRENREKTEAHREPVFESPQNGEISVKQEKQKGLRLDFLRDLKLDDLILIGIGLLLLLDSEGENDIFVLIIAFLLLF